MRKKTNRLLFFLLILLPFMSAGQLRHKHDSIIQLIREAPSDSIRAMQYLELGELYLETHQDTAIQYYQEAFKIARDRGHIALAGKCLNFIAVGYIYQSDYDKTIEYLERSIDYKERAGDSGGLANAYNNLGIIYKNQGDYEKALEYLTQTAGIRKALSKSQVDSLQRLNNIEKLGHVYNNQGNIYYQFGDYARAITYYNRSLEHYEKVGYSRGISACYNNIGSVFEEQENFGKALEYYERALKLNRDLDIARNIGTCLNNIGEVHLKSNQLARARQYFEESLEYRTKANDKRGISAVYSNLAMVNMKTGRYETSLDQLYKALKLDNEMGDKKAMSEDLVYLAEVYLHQGQVRQAIDFARQGQALADSIEAPLQKKSSLEILARSYEKQGQYKKALEYTRMFEDIEDDLFNQEKNEQIEELETKYQMEKKQEQIERQDILLEKQQAVIRRQKLQNYAYVGAIVFVLAISVLVYVNYRQKRRANRMLKEQNEEIEAQNEELTQQNEEIRIQRDELERQRNLAHKQRNEIAFKNDEITSSIRYAKSIQSSLLTPNRLIEKMLPGHFILFKPKDIVSGDFYWFYEDNGQVLFASVDCTGHGVPGAFMSLLGMSYLQDVVAEMSTYKAGDVLDRLRVKVIHALRQESPEMHNRDSMDISLCIWDKREHTLQYAGAYNPLYLFRDGELQVYKANRMTIGVESRLEKTFTTHRIPLQQGDMVYLFTDGYPDQLSQDNHEKMNIKRFKELIVSFAPLSPHEQKIKFDQHFNSWKGNYEQVDDVLVMGVRF